MRQGFRTLALAATVMVTVAGAAGSALAGDRYNGPRWAGDHYGSPPVSVEIIAPIAPPPPRNEFRPRPPGPIHAFVWVPGYWAWEHGHYAWVSGHWDRPPHRGGVWIEGHWAPRHHHWVWVPGHWR